MMARAVGPDEWWAVDGEILRIRPQAGGGYKRVNMEEPDPRPKPVTVKKRLSDRIQRLEQIRIRDNVNPNSHLHMMRVLQLVVELSEGYIYVTWGTDVS